MKLGDKVIRTVSGQVASGTVTKVGMYYVWVDNQHALEDHIKREYLLPDTPENRALLEEEIALQKRQMDERRALGEKLRAARNAE